MQETVVTGSSLMSDVLIYAGLSYIIVSVLDVYASAKLGKKSPGFKALKPHRLIVLTIASLLSIVLLILSTKGISMKASTETFLGVPYFALWFFYMVSVMHRIKSENGTLR